MKSWVDISIAGRSTERHRLQSGTTTLGSGSTAGIQLRGLDSLLAEHFSLRPQPEGCWVELVESSPEPFTFDGRPSRGCLVPWDQELFYGAVRVQFHAEAPSVAARRVSPVVWTAALVVPAVAFMMQRKPGETELPGGADMARPPALFGDAPPCAASRDGALHRGSIAEQVAHAKHERGNFELADAVEAIQLMRESSQCYMDAGHDGNAERIESISSRWTDKLDAVYQSTLLELELAQRRGKEPAILQNSLKLQTLLAYAGPKGTQYLTWLDQLARHQRAARAAKAAQKKKK